MSRRRGLYWAFFRAVSRLIPDAARPLVAAGHLSALLLEEIPALAVFAVPLGFDEMVVFLTDNRSPYQFNRQDIVTYHLPIPGAIEDKVSQSQSATLWDDPGLKKWICRACPFQ